MVIRDRRNTEDNLSIHCKEIIQTWGKAIISKTIIKSHKLSKNITTAEW